MSFSTIASEILDIFVTFYRIDTIERAQTPEDRMKATLLLLQITSRFRAVAISHRTLWTSICLEWHWQIVDLYLHHADFGLVSKSPIRVHLDTRRALQKKIEEKREYWPAFFAQELERIDILDIHICSGLGKDSLAFLDVIGDAPAPCLQRLDLYFDEDVTDNASLRRLFGGNAPHLQTVHISAAQPFDISHFRTVKHAIIRISHHSIKGIFGMISDSPELRKLELKGAQKWMAQFLPQPPAQPVHLQACTALTIVDVHSRVAEHLFAGLFLPNLEHLVVREFAIFHNNLIVTSFPTALRRLSHPAEPRD